MSLGKPSTATSSGHMVVMSQEAHDRLRHVRQLGPANGYRGPTIVYAMRLTWGGEYIHSAPWSV